MRYGLTGCTGHLSRINPDIPLGFYECPFPYKRLLTPDLIKAILKYNRFYFLKDTCCDLHQILEKTGTDQ